MKKHLPNFLTCCNLLCGALGIIYIFEEYGWGKSHLITDIFPGYPPAYFVWAACIFDFFDGFAARALKVSSSIGKELDSLADMVSFGVLPGVFMYKFIQQQTDSTTFAGEYLPYMALLVTVFSALRLAIFNVDETQKDSFRGLPTPANTIFLTGLPFLPFAIGGEILALICVVFSLFLVARFELFALKFKNFSWNENKLRFTFLIMCLLLVITLKFTAIPAIIILYIVLSLSEKAIART